jgi:hypothetical protein
MIFGKRPNQDYCSATCLSRKTSRDNPPEKKKLKRDHVKDRIKAAGFFRVRNANRVKHDIIEIRLEINGAPDRTDSDPRTPLARAARTLLEEGKRETTRAMSLCF